MAVSNRWLQLFILFSFAFIARSSDDYDCVYTVYVKTGPMINGGTDSIISLTLYDVYGGGLLIRDLEEWGVMEHAHNYYEKGNLDIFSGRGPCMSGPACSVNLTSDGSGQQHGWYCNYLEVTLTGPHVPCAQQLFTVEQWLAFDTYPYELTAIRNYCPYETHHHRDHISSPSFTII